MFHVLRYRIRSLFWEIDSARQKKKRELEAEIKHQQNLREIRNNYNVPPAYYASLLFSRLLSVSLKYPAFLLGGGLLLLFFQFGFPFPSQQDFTVSHQKGEFSAKPPVLKADASSSFIESSAYAAVQPERKVKEVSSPAASEKDTALSNTPSSAEERKATPLPVVAEKGGSYLILVDKQKRRMWLYEKLPDRYFLVESFPVSVGRLMGDKKAEGDLRTPEGSYKVVKIKTDDELPSQYGPFAFVLNYPNEHDRKLGKTGSGIWIHGSGANRLTPDTKGCVELSNRNLLRLRNYIYKDIPVYIYPTFPEGIQGEKEMPLTVMQRLISQTEQG